MTPNDFCRWLSGFVELHDGDSISARQWELIKKHLAEVQPEAKTPVYGPLTYPPGVRSAPFTPTFYPTLPQVPTPIGAPPVIYGIAQEESSIPSDCML